jgi:colanic acid biosynthesis glycosyl transferase WcaI
MLSLVFAPDGVSTAQLMTELAVDLRRAGLPVTVITTRPHYNRDLVAESAQPLTAVWPGLLWRSEVGGVRVYHCRVAAKAGGIVRRAPGWALFHLLALCVGLTLVRRADVVFVPSPLLTLGALGRLLARALGGRLVYNVQELYPDLAIELGMVRNPSFIRALRALERYVYRASARVTTITEGIRQAVIAKGIAPERVVTVPNFVDLDELRPAPKTNEFAATHGWTSRFVVLYAGNIGYAQGLEALLAVAAKLERDSSILFAFVGEGAAKEQLETTARAMGLGNVVFIPHQPYASVPNIYAAADLCVVSIVGGILVGALPSKVFRIMSCARPVLALCDPASDLASVVRQSESGVVCAPSDTEGMAKVIAGVHADRESAAVMGARGRAFVVEHLSRAVVTDRYVRLFTDLAAGAA